MISDISGKTFKTKNSGIYIIETFLILCALLCKIQVIPHDGTEVPFVATLVKFRESFQEPYGLELVLGGAIFCLFYFLDVLEEGENQRRHWQLIFLSGLFAFIFVYCRSIQELGSGIFLYKNGYQVFLSILCISGYWMLFHLALRWAYYLLQQLKIERQENLNFKRLWVYSFIAMILCWLPWLFASYPATFCPDSLEQLSQFFGLSPWTVNSVPLSTAIMGICVSLGAVAKNRTFGVFLYVLMQTCCGAAVFSYLLVTLRKMGCGRKAYFLAFAFYALFPLMPIYAQWFEKDFLYVVFFALSMTLLVSTLWESGCSKKRALLIAFAVTMTSLLRNNGKYELIPFLIALCFVLKKERRKPLVAALIGSVIVVASLNGIVYPALGMKETPVSEMLSVPFQQTARYVKFVPEEVSAEEKMAIEAVLDYENLASDYAPTISDPVKAKYHGDSESLKKYFEVWLQMGLKHPLIYADAFVHQAYGYLAPVKTEGEPPVKYAEDYYEEPELDIFRLAGVVPTALMDTIWIIMQRLPVIKLFATAGFYSWLVLACAVFLITKKRYYAVLPFVPGIINIFMCLVSAMSASIRYDLQVATTMPLLLWWTVLALSEKVEKK